MLGFLKRLRAEPFEVVAPTNGTLIDLSKVSDPVFAQKMMGDGFAIKPEGEHVIISAPVSGEIVSLPNSLHAVGIHTDNGIDVLVHVGIDTVNLKGKGFTAFAKQGDKVKHGDRLLEVDERILKENNLDNTVMVILTAGYDKPVKPEVSYDKKVTTDQKLLE